MLSRIQPETDPHTTKTRFSRRANFVSQASFSNAGKALSNAPIHDISSRNTTVFARPLMADARASKALAQPSAHASSAPVCADRRSQKWLSCVAFVTPSSGASPVISMKRHLDRAANSSISVDFPTRRRPEQTTRDGESLPHNSSRVSNSSFLPANMALSLLLLNNSHCTSRTSAYQEISGGYLIFCK